MSEKSLFNDHLLQLTEDVMRVTHYHLARAFLGFTAILTLGCGDSTGPSAPTTGAIVVTVSTLGASIDEEAPGAYGLTIDGGRELTVGVNATLIIGGVSKGNHLIRLDGLAPNCSVDGTNPRNVAVSPGGAALLVAFNVVCVEPALSGTIAFVDWDAGYYGIYTASAGGVRLNRLSHANSLDIDPAWSPDGTRIAYSNAPPSGDWDLWVMNADGTNQVRLTLDGEPNDRPAWSPDNRRIVFVSIRNRSYPQLYIINADGTGLTQLTNVIGNDTDPDWSPDGRRILFSRDMNGLENKGLFTMDPDGSNVRQLTSGHWDYEPAWSPDGTLIAFIREGETTRELFIMNSDGSNARPLVRGNQTISDPAWSPDGLTVAFGVITNSKICRDDYYGTGELYDCGHDVKRVGLDGVIDPTWVLSGAARPAWLR